MTRDAELYRPTDRPKSNKIRTVKRNKSVLPNGATNLFCNLWGLRARAATKFCAVAPNIFSKILQSPPTYKNVNPAERFSRHYSIAACHRSCTQILDITLRYIDNLCSPTLQATIASDSSIVTDRGSCEERRENARFASLTRYYSVTPHTLNVKITFFTHNLS